MKTSMAKLKAKMAARNMNGTTLAQHMGISKSAFYRRIQNDGLSFTIEEAHRMAEALGLSVNELTRIFMVE